MNNKMLVEHYKEVMIKDGFPINPEAIYLEEFDSVRTYGICRNKKYILLSSKLPNSIKSQVIVHELIHTIKSSKGHDRVFKEYAQKANTLYNMSVDTHASKEEINAFAEQNKPKYIIRCSKCSHVVATRYRNCDLVKNPSHYHSSCCNANLIVDTQ